MTSSAAMMAVLGLAMSFVPDELLRYAGAQPHALTAVLVQVCGALYLGFAMMNWMAKDNLIGGIYSRPVAMGNFMHFVVAGLALVKTAFIAPALVPLWVAAAVYALFALSFGRVVFWHPIRGGTAAQS